MYLLNPDESRADYTLYHIFTFHNVSIKSIWNEWFRDENLPLHSTMYLLNLGAINVCILAKISLHSTMYLLNRRTESVYDRSGHAFTFHNVSIKSGKSDKKQRDSPPLHSTMYLLNR